MKFFLVFLVSFFYLPIVFSASYDAGLRQEKIGRTLDSLSQEIVSEESSQKASSYVARSTNQALSDQLSFYSFRPYGGAENLPEKKKSNFYFEGDMQLSFGIDEGDFIWKRADPDLNESNWRILSDDAYNRYQNTFDPAVFSQLQFKAGYDSQGSGFGFHSYIDISPWSFTGKSDKITIDSDWGDSAEVQLKYLANTRYIVPGSFYSNRFGNIVSTGEQKVVDGKVSAFSRSGLPWDPAADIFHFEELDIKRDFWPLRELWFDYSGDSVNLRLFPASLQDQAYSSDDPLRLTNRHIWWAPSPWLTQWKTGHFNPDVEDDNNDPAPDFFKGYWDESLAYSTRNSAGQRITNLRGFSLSVDGADTLFDFTAASPKNLWQDYDDFDTVNSAMRFKHFYSDDLLLGFTHTSKYGLDGGVDAFNHVFSFDTSYGLSDHTALSFQFAASRTRFDRKTDYESKSQGNTYHFNLTHSSEDVFDKYFYGIRPKEEDDPFYRIKLSFTRMDANFDAALADYRHPRDDAYWSRHLTFRRPFAYEYFGLYGPSLGWHDILPYRIGDGVDSGRNTVSLRWEAENIFSQHLDFLFDIRDVRSNSGSLIENVSRLEGTYSVTPRLRLKGLGIHHYMPKTEEGVDPFMVNNEGVHHENKNIKADRDPSLKTFSAGIEYDFFDWMTAHFIWERSNDTTLAYDNFPRGLFEWDNVDTYTQGGKTYRQQVFGLYDDLGAFPTPNYPYYNILKGGLLLEPLEDLHLYLTYTHNDYRWAQIIDENMNHLGLEASYIMDNKLGFYLRYVYARANNLRDYDHGKGRVNRTGHHNVFTEAKYRVDAESEIIAQYGVGGYGLVATPTETPFGGGVAVLDTQHIFRLYYRRKF